ncbi:PIN domain-containing protein [Hoyosella sp. G463]|uniref:PIN domain-containing protein n=1 Tax=Lolliginicoccus lacisalsi TaxID=2742202 RepID=A0A927JAF0_9ACTN|nr:PIN domain-containing protein [Lolliginicoccus lacisalsi]
MSFPVVLDACVLVPLPVCDLMLRLADAGLYRPLWSEEILDEVERNLPKLGVTPARAAKRISQMRNAFPSSAVTGYERLVPTMGNHPKDRHVLAAAVRAGAQAVVTANLKDFPADALAPFGIEALHPDDFLQDLLDLDAALVLRCLRDQQEECRKPAFSLSQLLDALARAVPGFANQATQALFPPGSPLPLEIVSSQQAVNAFFPDSTGLDHATARGAAYLWWTCLLALDEPGAGDALAALSASPADWGDFRQAARELSGWAMAQNLIACPDAPDAVAYAKFVPVTGHNMRAFADTPIRDVYILTVVRCPDGYWRVWGMSRNWLPPLSRIEQGARPGSR